MFRVSKPVPIPVPENLGWGQRIMTNQRPTRPGTGTSGVHMAAPLGKRAANFPMPPTKRPAFFAPANSGKVSELGAFWGPGGVTLGEYTHTTGGGLPGPAAPETWNITDVANETIGIPSNWYINHHKMARAYSKRFSDVALHNHLVLCKKERGALNITQREVTEDSRRYIYMGVPHWNFCQAAEEKEPQTPEEVLDPNDIWEDWYVEGVVKSEEGATEPGETKRQNEKERMINASVRGHSFTYNGWGSTAQSYSNLWLILKKPDEPLSDQFVLLPYSHGPQKEYRDNERRGMSGLKPKSYALAKRPHQLYFWSDPVLEFPPDSVLVYYDEFGRKRYGKKIYVGRSDRGTAPHNKRSLGDLHRNMASLISQPKIFMYVNPGLTL